MFGYGVPTFSSLLEHSSLHYWIGFYFTGIHSCDWQEHLSLWDSASLDSGTMHAVTQRGSTDEPGHWAQLLGRDWGRRVIEEEVLAVQKLEAELAFQRSYAVWKSQRNYRMFKSSLGLDKYGKMFVLPDYSFTHLFICLSISLCLFVHTPIYPICLFAHL